MKRITKAFSVVGAVVAAAFLILILTYVSLTIHHMAVQTVRNDRAPQEVDSISIGSFDDFEIVDEFDDIDELQALGLLALTGEDHIDTVFDDLELWIPDTLTLGEITIYGSGEVDYPGDVSEAAKEFWEAVKEAFPEMDWGQPKEVRVEK